jgi:DNA invertase Pin-like site-specific DNA recombinase
LPDVRAGRVRELGGPSLWRCAIRALLVGYARCSTDQQDLTAQRDALAGLGVEPDRIYVDHGLTGTNRERPGLREALAACRSGDTLVVTKCTVEGMKVAKAKGRLRGKQPKLNRKQEAHLVSLVHSGEYSTLEVAELFSVGRSTVYRAIERQRIAAKVGIAETSSSR